MRTSSGFPRFLSSAPARILTVLLLLQAALFYNISHGRDMPLRRALEELPAQFGDWRMLREDKIEDEVQQVLRADHTLSRIYASPSAGTASLFVAYFKSQRTGQAPHSPKNCMPGAGWVESSSTVIPLTVPGRAAPIEVNHYVLAKGVDKNVVLYWYQANQRVIASEYKAKILLVADAIRYDRTDTALVRVVIPVDRNTGDEEATKTAAEFVRSFFDTLSGHLPG